jgi:hypothetical protein
MGKSGEILLFGRSEITGEVGLFRKAVQGLHARRVVKVDPVEGPVPASSSSVSINLSCTNIVDKDIVVTIVVVCDLHFVLGWIRRMNQIGDAVDTKGFPSPCVVSIHVVNGGFEERCAAAFFVKHDNATTSNLADLDFLAFGGFRRGGLGRRCGLISLTAGPVFGRKWIGFVRVLLGRGSWRFSRRSLD